MTQKASHWYLFSRPSELQSALMQCDSQTLLSPYNLFRLECSGNGQCFLLLEVKGARLPEGSQLIPLVLQQKKGKQHKPILSSEPFRDLSPSAEDWSADSFRLSFHTQQDKSSQYTGWAFPLRHGNHLLASVGLEEAAAYTSISWVLFQVPTGELYDNIANHLSLGRHDIRCSSVKDGKHWLLIREPELYLVLKWKSTPNVQIYQSFPTLKNLMTPWSYYTPLHEKIHLASPQTLLVLDLTGGSQWLDVSSWWQPSEIITLPSQLAPQTIASESPPTQVPVKLRYLKTQSTDIPRLWVLQGPTSLSILENLALQLPPAERSALQLFVGEHPSTQEQWFVIQDNRAIEEPLFQTQEAIGFLPLLADIHLYVQSNYKVQPTLPASVWQRDLSLSTQSFTLLQPSEKSETEIVQFPRESLIPFEDLIEYRMGGEIHELQELAKATLFDVLFSPEPIPQPMPTLKVPFKRSIPKREQEAQSGNATSSPPPKLLPNSDTPTNQCRHPRGLMAKNEQLQRLEVAIQTRNRSKAAVTPKDWLELADLYNKEYHLHNKEMYWLGEAISCLDQIFNLSRNAEKALALEQSMITEFLELPAHHSFEALYQKLEEHTQGDSTLHARFAFRYAARLLIFDELPPEQSRRLRQKFYADLANLDSVLLTLEHRIFVGGVAKLLNDHELVARTRQRYRARLDTGKRTLQELPHVVRP